MDTNLIKQQSGKPLSKSQINLLAKLETLGVVVGNDSQVRTNPFSGVSCNLTPLAVALYDFVVKAYGSRAGLTFNGKTLSVSTWDNTRYLFMAIWPDEYFKLLD
jgi:hypothetical protein